MGKISIKYLAADLRAVRDQAKNKRKNCANKVLERLGYTRSKSISIEQFDALLIRAIDQSLGISRDADVLLMAFGLLQGYHYAEIMSIGERRKKYLAESNYLETHPRKQIPYADATKEQKDDLEDNLRKAEDGRVESLALFLSEQDIPGYIKDNIASITIPQPSYILLAHGPEPALTDGDDGVLSQDTPPPDDEDAALDDEDFVPDEETTDSEKTSEQNKLAEEPLSDGSEAMPPQPDTSSGGDPTTTEGQGDSRSREESKSDTSDQSQNPKRFGIHIGKISIGPFINIDWKSQPNFNLTWVKNSIFFILVVIAAAVIWVNFFHPQVPPESELPSEDELPAVEEILVTSNDIILAPNERRELAAAVLPVTATGAALSYVSTDTTVVTVRGYDGMLQAKASHAVGGVQPADIIIQAENGVTTTKTIFVDFSEAGYAPPVEDINDFVPSFLIIQKIRLAGTTEWATSVNAEIGDIVEIQTQYKNINEIMHKNVMIRDVLPPNLEYISGTTKLYNVMYDGGVLSDDITTKGVNLGDYTPDSNAYVRFSAKVVDENLAPGSNTLVNWSQGGVGPVMLQDYAAVVVQK